MSRNIKRIVMFAEKLFLQLTNKYDTGCEEDQYIFTHSVNSLFSYIYRYIINYFSVHNLRCINRYTVETLVFIFSFFHFVIFFKLQWHVQS